MRSNHHCPICENNVMKSSCIKKGHLWHCKEHDVLVRRDWTCVSCDNVIKAAERAKRAEAEKAKKDEAKAVNRSNSGRGNAR